MIHVAFVGVRADMPDQQAVTVTFILETLAKAHPGEVTLHHGCALGADKQIHAIARGMNLPIVGHPTILQPENERDQYTLLHPPVMPLTIKRNMVQICDAMIVAPAEMQEMTRIGTWITKRQMEKAGKPHALVLPNGASAYGEQNWPA